MTTEMLAVALPVHNGAPYLREALDSVLGQDFADFELVVSDNASTDETPAILAEYAARDRRMRVSRSEAFLRQADNTNRAVGLSEATWVKLMCHDDLLERSCLSRIHEAIATAGTDRLGLVGHGESRLFTNGYQLDGEFPHGTTAEVRCLDGRELARMLLRGGATAHLPSLTTATVRRAAWAATPGFDPDFTHFDTFFWMRLMMSWDYLYLPEALAVNRIHGRQVTVELRMSLRTADDHRRFWPGYLDEHGAALGLGRAARLRVGMKPVAAVGPVIAGELLKRNWGGSLRLALRTPKRWWPIVPLAVARSYRSERGRSRRIAAHVPYDVLYPAEDSTGRPR